MEELFNELIEFILISGKRLVTKAGQIKDIGVKKKYLTEEDINIERGMKEIIKKHQPTHSFFAEEEHDEFPEGGDLWIADPISGTKTFIKGLPHYGVVLAYSKNKEVVFAVVYDPSADELFTAYKDKGAFLNGKKIFVSNNSNKVIFNLSYGWKDETSGNEMLTKLNNFNCERNKNSHGVNLCHVACGRYDGVICFGKDSFPMYAGALMIKEAAGIFTNYEGATNFEHTDRVFIGGNKEFYSELTKLVHSVNLPLK